ncbi:Calumenin-A [Halotydeus destructor]|nr:Calumenin-A [Halotydeus destructor]
MSQVILLAVLTALLCQVGADSSKHQQHTGGAEADEHLHQSQIPAPAAMPSDEVVKKAIGELIDDVIDADKDGLLSADELRKLLERNHHEVLDANLDRQWVYYKPTVEEVHSWEGYAPENKEVLHWNDYKELTYPEEYLKDDPTNEHYKSMQIMQKRSERRWELADANSDTVLTKEEFKNFVHPEESEKYREVIVDEAMEDMDVDKDGSISLDEYIAHMSDVTEETDKVEGWQEEQQSQFASYLDKNKDGVLSNEELRDWLIPPFDRHEAEAYRLIQVGDSNDDRQLSKAEVLEKFHEYYTLLGGNFWTKFLPEEAAAHDEL